MTAISYCISLLCVEYANSKPKDIKIILISLIVLAFSIWNGWAMNVKQNTLSLDAIEQEWERYVSYCKEEHISWSDLTFPEWLSVEASEWDLIEVYE
jgi:hypothetical protein